MSEAQPSGYERPEAERRHQDAGPDAPRSDIDIACGELAFVDLTFPGLESLPAAGEERHAGDFLRSPGGGAITAIGAARLGLSSALVSPIGADAEGDFLRDALAAEGVRWAGRQVPRTAVTAVLPADGDRAMATFDPGEQVTPGELAAVAPRAVVLSLPRLAAAPPGARLYASVGDEDARAAAGASVPGIERAHALLVNEREAHLLSGALDPTEAARRLGELTERVVVTLGAGGAVELSGGELLRAEGVHCRAVDTTGAGDLFAAAYVWADLAGADPLERLRWAVLYASLSVAVETAVAGAKTLATLMEAGARHGLAPPAGGQSLVIEEEAR
jgi:sugar/nucleoside kinase (ribokinase family)